MLAIIPARGGSKGLPGKNIKLLCGIPLIVHTIKCAQRSKYVTKIIVSTDEVSIAECSMNAGAEVPFMRPDKLARDKSLAIDNYLYTIERLNREENSSIKEIIVLQPTSPLRVVKDIDNSIELYTAKQADSVISVTKAAHPPSWAKIVDNKSKIYDYFENTNAEKNRQEYLTAYVPNGAIFILKYSLLKEEYSYYSEQTYAYEMPNERALDIDTQLDFDFAEFLMRRR
jgi:CMP-N,N'-diacetyllegionaminic acid synthase